MIAALLVTWKVSGQLAIDCPKGTPADSMTGLCFVPVAMNRTQAFDSQKAAEDFVKYAKAYKNPSVAVLDVHLYSEAGAK